jgi:hypothetical protein
MGYYVLFFVAPSTAIPSKEDCNKEEKKAQVLKI